MANNRIRRNISASAGAFPKCFTKAQLEALKRTKIAFKKSQVTTVGHLPR